MHSVCRGSDLAATRCVRNSNRCQHLVKSPSSLPFQTNARRNFSKKPKSQNTPSSSSSSSTTQTTNNHDYKQSLSAFTIGTLAGTMGSLAGMGGGFIMIPLMTSSHKLLSMNLTQHVAHGTSLFAVAATGIAGATSYATSKKQAVDVHSAMCITICAMMTARLGALYSTKLSQVDLKKVLGVFMICVSPVIPLKPYLNEWKNKGSSDSNDDHNQMSSATAASSATTRIKDFMISGGIGLGSGFMAGLLGVGGGAIVVPALTLFTTMDHYQALGTSLAAMIAPAVVGTMTHYKKGNVNLRVAPALAMGSLFGAYVGGKVGVNVEEDTLRYGFSSLMFGLGLKTLLKG